MLQFTDERLAALRAAPAGRQAGPVTDALLAATEELRTKPLIIQDAALATWGHYYACPDHAVRLVHELDRPDSFRCPVDGKRWTGEPYAGAWWRLTNGKNADGARDLSYLWLLTDDEGYRDLALRILTGYAERYPSYAVHGNIPHNGPGKANCQTLCEGMFIRSLAQAWDVLRGTADPETAALVERGLFAEAGEFLANHITPQRHNHEVLVAGALGMVGILLGRDDLIDAARNADYGLVWQLERSVLSDGFWFEGSVHYHAFALEAFLAYETFACRTRHSLWGLGIYRKMLRFCAAVLLPDGTHPMINDGGGMREIGVLPRLFEYAYAQDGSEEWARVLRFFYRRTERGGVETFLHGAPDLPPVDDLILSDYHDGAGSGLTVLRGPGDDYFLARHGPFGGEHDHYDRLSFCWHLRGEALLPDLSTVSYGSPMHYRYYKNTAAHNTLVLDGANHPPADCRVRRFLRREDGVLLETEVDWKRPYPPFDSHYREEWTDGPYLDASMRRLFLKTPDYLIDLVEAAAPNARSIDLNTLVAAELRDEYGFSGMGAPSSESASPFARFEHSGPYGAPYAYLRDARRRTGAGSRTLRFSSARTELLLLVADGGGGAAELFTAVGPDNPPQGDLVYVVRRETGPTARFLALYAPRAKGGTDRGAPLPVAVCLENGAGDGRTVAVSFSDGSERRHPL